MGELFCHKTAPRKFLRLEVYARTKCFWGDGAMVRGLATLYYCLAHVPSARTNIIGGRGLWPHEACCGLPTASCLSETGKHELAFTQTSKFTTYLPSTQGPKPGLIFCTRQNSANLVHEREIEVL